MSEKTHRGQQEVRDYNVGDSNYADKKIQPWDIWLEYNLNPWDADIIKRVLRTKKGNSRRMDYEKIIHICQERIRQIDEKGNDNTQAEEGSSTETTRTTASYQRHIDSQNSTD